MWYSPLPRYDGSIGCIAPPRARTNAAMSSNGSVRRPTSRFKSARKKPYARPKSWSLWGVSPPALRTRSTTRWRRSPIFFTSSGIERLLDHQAADFVMTAQEQLNRITEITTRTLRFHRQSVSAISTRLAELLDFVLAIYRSRLAGAEIEVYREYQRLPPVTCFAGDLRQAVGNLIGNAVDALTSGGRLRIRLRQARRWQGVSQPGIRVTIADTGVGIPQEHRGTSFEPFFTTKGSTGTGLGLWVTRDLIGKHEGTVTFRSSTRAGASGTVMSIFLPARPDEKSYRMRTRCQTARQVAARKIFV